MENRGTKLGRPVQKRAVRLEEVSSGIGIRPQQWLSDESSSWDVVSADFQSLGFQGVMTQDSWWRKSGFLLDCITCGGAVSISHSAGVPRLLPKKSKAQSLAEFGATDNPPR